MSQPFSYVIEAGGTGLTGSLKITVNSDVPYYLTNLRDAIVKGTGNIGTESTVVIILINGQKVIFPYIQISTIGGDAPISLTDSVNKITALIAGGGSAPTGNLLIDNDGNFLITNDGDFILSQT